jgi:hypothetical protein
MRFENIITAIFILIFIGFFSALMYWFNVHEVNRVAKCKSTCGNEVVFVCRDEFVKCVPEDQITLKEVK